MRKAWSDRGEKLEQRGKAGREYVLDPEFGFTASEMCRRFVHDMHLVWDNFKPASRMLLTNATKWYKEIPKNNGLTLTKEIA